MNKVKCIYAIKDKRSDKVIYIGQTKDFQQRKKRHFIDKKTHIDNFMFEQGRDNFEMYVIEEFSDNISKEIMKMKEQEYIEKYNTIKEGLNIKNSGNKEFQEQYQEEYNKEYRKTQKYKDICKQYKKSDKGREYNKKWYLEHKDKCKNWSKQWYENNREKKIEQSRLNYQKKKQEKLNQEQI